MRPAGWAFESSWLLTGAQELGKNSSTISFTGKAISPGGFVQAALQNVSNTIKYEAQGQVTGTPAHTHQTGMQEAKHHATISAQLCTWRQLCHPHTLALVERVGPVQGIPFSKTSFSTACPLLSICLNDLWTPGTRDVPFCSKPTIQTPLFPPSSECFESLPCCLWTEIRKKHFGTHDAGRSGAGIASFWVVCCFNNVTPPLLLNLSLPALFLVPLPCLSSPFQNHYGPLGFLSPHAMQLLLVQREQSKGSLGTWVQRLRMGEGGST